MNTFSTFTQQLESGARIAREITGAVLNGELSPFAAIVHGKLSVLTRNGAVPFSATTEHLIKSLGGDYNQNSDRRIYKALRELGSLGYLIRETVEDGDGRKVRNLLLRPTTTPIAQSLLNDPDDKFF